MPQAVILTALPVEYLAVRSHLTDLQEEMHPQGTIYERGKFTANGQVWEVGIAEVGAGNAGSAIEAERAIAYFKPDVLFFVGIAGGIKDVAIGDVVAATKVYSYESGRMGNVFFTCPALGQSAHALVHRARAEARKREWVQRLSNTPNSLPRVFLAPIAAGEKVVASRESELFNFIRASYNDAIAVEMEGFGFLSAAFDHPEIKAIVIRGVSDLLEDENNNSEAAEQVQQEKAALHASAFAFEVLAKYLPNNGTPTELSSSSSPAQHEEETHSTTLPPERSDQSNSHPSRLILAQRILKIILILPVVGLALVLVVKVLQILNNPFSPTIIHWQDEGKRLITIEEPCVDDLNQAREQGETVKEVIEEHVSCNDPEGWIYLNNAEAERSQNPIRLVISVAIDQKKLGQDDSLEMLRGVAQAQIEINQNGGINDRKLWIGIADDNEDPSHAKSIARSLVSRSDIWGSIGHGSSSTTAAAAMIYDQKLVTISPTSTAIRRSKEYPDGLQLNSFVFRTASNDSIAAQNLADYAWKHYVKAAIVYDSENLYSQSLRQAFETRFKTKGGEIIGPPCDLSDKSFTPEQCLAAVENAQILLLIPTDSTDVEGIIARNFQQAKLPLLGGDTMYNNSILSLEGVTGMVVAVPWHRNNNSPSDFERKAAQFFGTGSVNWRSAMTYDAAQALRKALKIALREGCEEATRCRKAIQEILLRRGFAADGALGEATVKFDPSGDRSIKDLKEPLGVLVQADSSTFVPVP